MKAIEMKGMVKVYPNGTVALRGVDFTVNKGEIHALLGENGAGKTTLMEILYGMIRKTEGEIYVRGERVDGRSPKDSMNLGIGMVHQHFTLIPVFTALQNVVLGIEPVKWGGMLNLEAARGRMEELIEQTGLKVDLDAPVETLSTGEKQRVEILKMLYRNADILILDEPTAVLTPLEVDELFGFLEKMKAEGRTITFITHKLKEVKETADRVTVLRQGKVVDTVDVAKVSMEDLARMMVGREVLFRIEKPSIEAGSPVLIIENLSVLDDRGAEAVKNVCFEVFAGEIFGVAGVEGNGQTELVETITGLREAREGKIVLAGQDVTGTPPDKLYSMGLGHIPEDRHGRGVILDFSVAENSILGLHNRSPFVNRLGAVDEEDVLEWTRKLVDRFNIDIPGMTAPVKNLSGGNQQKLIVGRELMKDPKVVIAAQPTRGLDVAATEYIRSLLIQMRNEGRAVLLVSADLDEVIMLSDRMAVMYEGRFMGSASPKDISRREIGLMMGGLEMKDIQKEKIEGKAK